MYKPCVITVVLLLTLSSFVDCLDIESAKERKCFEPNKTEPVDLQWLTSQKVIYYPIMSKLDLYITAAEITRRDYKDITEDDLNDACVVLGLSPEGIMICTGFQGKSIGLSVQLRDPGMEAYGFAFEDGIEGNCFTTMTDNKSFVVTLCCSNGDEMSWSAISTIKTLPKETLKKIYEHIEAMGFSKEWYAEIRYDSCDLETKKEEL